MTQIKAQAPTRRETATCYRGRPLMVELRPGYLVIRQKGRRAGYEIDYRAIFEAAAKIRARQEREEKRAKRGR